MIAAQEHDASASRARLRFDIEYVSNGRDPAFRRRVDAARALLREHRDAVTRGRR